MTDARCAADVSIASAADGKVALCRQDSMYIMSTGPRVRHVRGPATMALAPFLRGVTPSVHRVRPSPSTSSRGIERFVTGSSRAI